MRLLSIETSGSIFSLLLWKDGNIEYAYKNEQAFSASKWLAPIMKECLQKTNLSIDHIDHALYNCGPGSFTGLRVALSFLKGLFYDQPEKIIAIPSFDILQLKNDEQRIPIFEAKRDEIYILEKKEIRHIKKNSVNESFDSSTKFIAYTPIQPAQIFECYDISYVHYDAQHLIDVFLSNNENLTFKKNETELIYIYD